MNARNAETIDMTPTWAGLLPALLALAESSTAAGKKTAREEFARMAKAADQWNANAAALVELVKAARNMAAEVSPQSTGLAPHVDALRDALAPFAALAEG